jgi:SAM-dependent methyltransferase
MSDGRIASRIEPAIERELEARKRRLAEGRAPFVFPPLDEVGRRAVLLNRLTGLDDRVEVHKGSALDLPFPDDSFDVVWMQNVGMNIADKRKLYGEIYRVLKPAAGTPSRRWLLGKRLRPIFRFRGPPTLPTASLSLPKRLARFSARVDSSLNSSRIPATLI